MTFPVYKALLKPDLILGVPKPFFMLCLLLLAMIYGIFGIYFMPLILLIFIPGRIISKEDPDMLLLAGDALFEPDFLAG